MVKFNKNTLWVFFLFHRCTSDDKIVNNLISSTTGKNLEHLNESTWNGTYKNVIFSRKIPLIRPRTTETAVAPPAGNNSNYISDAAVSSSGTGDSKQIDLNIRQDGFKKRTIEDEIDKKPTDLQINDHKMTNVDLSLNYEEPQKLILNACEEMIAKTYKNVQKNHQNDMENENKEKYRGTKAIKSGVTYFLNNKLNNGLKNYPYSKTSTSLKLSRAPPKYETARDENIKSIVERDIAVEQSAKLLKNTEVLEKFEKPNDKPEEATKKIFIYNPTILDSADDYSKHDSNKSNTVGLTEKNSYTESVWQESDIKKPEIRFSELPQREKYLMSSLKLEEGPFPFEFMSGFFTLIYPFDVPIELLRDILWGNFSFPYSLIKSIRLESTFLACVLLMAMAALVVPSYLACRMALSACAPDNSCAESELMHPVEDHECRRRLMVTVLMVVMIMCGVCIVGMALSNEGAAAAVGVSRTALRCACADLSVWITAAARDLRHVLALPADLVLAHYREDLNGVEQLLGEPIQKAIASESGVYFVLDSVNDITTESTDLAFKISSLRDLCVKGSQLAVVTSERLRDLKRQLESVKKLCSGRDAPLCDTINSGGLELQIKFDWILHEPQLLQLRSLGAENLTRAASEARQEFRALPAAIASQTAWIRQDIARDMEARRNSVHQSSRVLNDMVRHLSAALQTGSRKMEAVLSRLMEYDLWRWSVMLGCTVVAGFVVTLTICGLLCGCCNAGKHAKRTLQVSTGWMCITSLAIWTMVAAAFLFAGHAEVYGCRGLWDEPEYRTLSKLLDKPAEVPGREPHWGGMFQNLFQDLENVTIDVPVKDVIRDCSLDRPAYIVFRLDKALDISKETDYFDWPELSRDLKSFADAVDVGSLKTISQELSYTLQDMLRVSYVNMAHYRLQYNGPLVGKDIASLAEQLENVASQLSDLSTSARIESLVSRTRRLLVTNLSPLDQLRTELVYKLTELELQLVPFHRQLNTSLSHIHTMQYYIDNQSDMIAQKMVAVYTGRLQSHTAGWRTHALSTATTRAARCRPLYDIFSSSRSLLCSHYVASLHGYWLCAMCCAALWCYVVPTALQLCTYLQKRDTDDTVLLANLNASQHDVSSVDNNWNTPGPPPPPDGSW